MRQRRAGLWCPAFVRLFALRSIHQVCDVSGNVFLFDITKMGNSAFEDFEGMDRPTLKTLLECPNLLKVIFDGRADADALWHLYNVYMAPVYCLQVWRAQKGAPFAEDFFVWGSLKRNARAVQLFGRLAVLETHTLRY